MLSIEDLQNKLKDCNIKKVSENSNIGYSIVYRISKGESSVSYKWVKKLSDYFLGVKNGK